MGQVHLAWPLTIQEKLLQNGGVNCSAFQIALMENNWFVCNN